MVHLQTGQFYGQTDETIHLDGITLTDTEYTHKNVDWHSHENAYFTFIIDGKLLEGDKKNIISCNTGSLLFHNSQEAHYNIKPDGFTRGFQIEVDQNWFDTYQIRTVPQNGILNLANPQMKMLMYNIFRESKLSEMSGQPAIDSLLLELFSLITGLRESAGKRKPEWTNKIRDILNDSSESLTLTKLATLIDIHPVHLSREFRKYFNCNLGDYIRTINIQRALALMPEMDLSLTRIALQCNFADQSHFIRSFKTQYHITPLHYRKLLGKNYEC